MIITLQRDGVACTLDPRLGGSLLSLSVDGFDLLRPAPDATGDVLAAACFPLVPFANRIANGRIGINGREVVLPADPATPPHAHHGHGWRRAWDVVESSESVAELELRHSPDAWPWAYVATQRIALMTGGAVINLSVTNLSAEDMPAGLGLHPYFVRGEADSFQTSATRIVVNGSDGIPVDEAPFQPGEKSLAELEGMDNLLLDESGCLRLRLRGVSCEMKASGAVGFHIYVPEQQGFFCVEPVSHRPNAFFSNAEHHAIAPGETRRLSMQLTTEAASTT